MHLNDKDFKKLAEYIEGTYGIRMPPTKRIMLESRLQKRLRLVGMESFSDYLKHVFEDPGGTKELVNMVDAVTTNKTDFFRESDHFDWMLRNLPTHIERDGWGVDRGPLRVWSAASSTGEEAYTLAIVLEELRRSYRHLDYRLLGTDISSGVLEQARKAIYPEARIEPVSKELRSRYFDRSKDRSLALVRIKPELRRRVRFLQLNLMDENYGFQDKFEIIFCRNVIIYFERPRQIRLLEHLLSHLIPGGYLFLGHSETLAGASLPVESVAPTIYRRISQ